MKGRLFLLLLAMFTTPLFAQQGHEITVEIEGYEETELYLANHIMDKQYIVDTAFVNEAGKFVFANASELLPAGIYLVVLAPEKNYFEILIGNEEDQVFSVKANKDELKYVEVESSQENKLFYDYMNFLGAQQEESLPYRQQLADTSITLVERTVAEEKMEELGEVVREYQDKLIKDHPKAFITAILQMNNPSSPPEYAEITDEEARNNKKLNWLKAHYFDKIDLKDPRLLRTPFLFQRINYYVDKLFYQYPDTVSMAIDQVLGKMDPESDTYKNYVVHFVNKAASSKIVGMDAVYVHMVDNYYANGKAYWADAASISKMVADVEKIRPLLIGEKAPNVKMNRRDGSPVELYDVEANYTILYFWQFQCGSCKKATPYMKEVYEKWKDKGVEIFAICTKQGEIDKCWEYVDEKEIGTWLHATDRYMRFYKDYDIRSTPTIFILDEDKKIVSKRIGAQQLDEVLTALEAQKAAGKK